MDEQNLQVVFPDYKTFFREHYSKTPHWARVRQMLRIRSGGVCETPGCTEMRNLQAHHIDYDYLFFEDFHLDHMAFLCPECHEKADAIRREEMRERRWGWHKQRQGTGASRYGGEAFVR